MTEGIGKIGGSNYGIGGFLQRKKGNDEGKLPENQIESAVRGERKEINPEKIFSMMNDMAIDLKPAVEKPLNESELKELPPDTIARIEDSMKEFETVFGIVEKEFGRTLAPEIMELLAAKR